MGQRTADLSKWNSKSICLRGFWEPGKTPRQKLWIWRRVMVPPFLFRSRMPQLKLSRVLYLATDNFATTSLPVTQCYLTKFRSHARVSSLQTVVLVISDLLRGSATRLASKGAKEKSLQQDSVFLVFPTLGYPNAKQRTNVLARLMLKPIVLSLNHINFN